MPVQVSQVDQRASVLWAALQRCLIHVEGDGGLVKGGVHEQRGARQRRGIPRAQAQRDLKLLPRPHEVAAHSLEEQGIIA